MQNVKVDFGTKDGIFARQTYEALISSLRYLQPSGASSTWKHAFLCVLRHSHSFRVREITKEQKVASRGSQPERCILCGRDEVHSPYLVELAGNPVESLPKDFSGYDARAFSDVTRLLDIYGAYTRGHQRVKERNWMREVLRRRTLPVEYLGGFSVGEGCLRRLKLAFVAQNFMLLTIDAMAREIGACLEAPEISKEAMRTYLSTMQYLERANTQTHGDVPEPILDDEYWQCLDSAIDAIAGEHSMRMRGERGRSLLGQSKVGI